MWTKNVFIPHEVCGKCSFSCLFQSGFDPSLVRIEMLELHVEGSEGSSPGCCWDAGPGRIQGLAAEVRASPGKGRNMLVLKGGNTQGLGSKAHPDPMGILGVIVTSLACGNT